MDALIKMLDGWFGQKAPAIPAKGREFIVKVAPWLVALSILLALPAILSLLGISMNFGSMMMYGYGYAGYSWLWIFMVATVVLDALALPGLFKRTMSGWTFVFYGVLVSLLSQLLMMNLVGFIISGVISFYLLFQVRSYYTAGGVTPPTPPTAA